MKYMFRIGLACDLDEGTRPDVGHAAHDDCSVCIQCNSDMRSRGVIIGAIPAFENFRVTDIGGHKRAKTYDHPDMLARPQGWGIRGDACRRGPHRGRSPHDIETDRRNRGEADHDNQDPQQNRSPDKPFGLMAS